ncbi:hypothetical protein ABIA13_006384 [Sinorhizobium fredii]
MRGSFHTASVGSGSPKSALGMAATGEQNCLSQVLPLMFLMLADLPVRLSTEALPSFSSLALCRSFTFRTCD